MKVATSREVFIAQLEKRGYKHTSDIPSLFDEDIEVTSVYSKRKSFTQYWVYRDHAVCVLVKIAEIILKEVYIFTAEINQAILGFAAVNPKSSISECQTLEHTQEHGKL